MIRAGGVYKFIYRPANKEKYGICVDPERGYFLLINTDPPYYRQAGLQVRRGQIRADLTHESFIDTSKLVAVQIDDLKRQEVAGEVRFFSIVSESLGRDIKACIDSHEIMPGWQFRIVVALLPGDPTE